MRELKITNCGSTPTTLLSFTLLRRSACITLVDDTGVRACACA